MEIDYQDFNPSVDLIKQAQRYLLFLRSVDRVADHLSKDHIIKNALRRYETIWLPLVARYANEELEAPLDVHWVWMVHILCPRTYAKDCARVVSVVPDHKFHSNHDHSRRAQDTARELWYKLEPEEPYDVKYEDIPYDQPPHQSMLRYDIVAASRRQLAFYYNVSLPHFNLVTFLEKALLRYRKFVNLKKAYSETFIVPMYDVDLIWHTHQLCPTDYRTDTTKFLGYVLNHDDSTTDRSTGSKLSKGDEETRNIWHEFYEEPFPLPGVMYRGEHPRGRLHTIAIEDVLNFFPKVYTVKVERIVISGNVKAKYRLGGTLSVSHIRGSEEALPTKKDLPFEWVAPAKSALLTFDVDARGEAKVNLDIERRDGVKGALFGKNFFSAQFLVSKDDAAANSCNGNGNGNYQTFKLSRESASGVKACVTFAVIRMRCVDALFRLKKGGFSPSIMPHDARHMWGPVTLPPLNPDKINLCNVASHIITDASGDEKFTAQVIHSSAMSTSVIQVYHGDLMVAVGHIIGSEQLPTKDQMKNVSDKCMTLDHNKGERAMLLKNSAGDWGILKGFWTGYKKGEPPKIRGQTGKRGDPGYLQAYFYDLQTDTVKEATLLSPVGSGGARSKKFKLQQITVGVNKGDMTVDGSCRQIAENIALALAVNVLFVLCEPRMHPPGIYPEGRKRSIDPPKNSIRRRGSVAVQALSTTSCQFFEAAGYNVETPSNSWLFWQWHRRHHHSSDNYSDNSFPDEKECSEHQDEVCTGVHEDALFCPWNPDGLLHGMDPSGCGGCGGCAASCGGTSATCGISTACGGETVDSAGEDEEDGDD